MTGTEKDDKGRLIAGRYRLQRRIGGGAMGVVWLAKDELLDRTVAVKQLLLSPNLSKEDAEHARKRSSREARIAARLQHRHAITVFDVADDDGLPVLIMEYLPSRSLSEVQTDRGALPPAEVARIGAQAAHALAAAHDAGIVHRDVKPGNILLGDDGTAKITDFGISKATDDGTLTGSGSFAGTPAYLSPEAARGEKPSPASDVFSLGATLYTIVEGRFPYGETENQMAMLYAAAAGRFNPPQKAGPLTEPLNRMMRLDPAERPTMAEVAAELEEISRTARQRRRPVLLYAGIAVVLLVAAVVTTVLVLKPWGGKVNDNAANGVSTSATASSAAQPGPTATDNPSPKPSSPSSQPPSSSQASSSSSATGPAGGGGSSAVQTVATYYSIMPGNPELGWTMIGPELQKKTKAVYLSWWSTVSELKVTVPAREVGANTVEITFEYTVSGTRYLETHDLGMINQGGQYLINTDGVASSRKIG
ncbi:serine/threonine protein kinase [Amycolatopsis rhizosphaerae]|uniref:non-specific serine/threonine protein kinase n=1 Tax=Amycolatopsis rhizosphaerae TaxID=2053003 RepID=A0A558ASN4_9PSEU|nr:serine/threonine-protein kinase [Amycolatopsis rhizosphaerae]TVT27206.1 serine/threonine protein kinase [Amycolatopsis rhizosphaerae]